MVYKKINLFLYGVLAIVLLFTIPVYNSWLYGKVLNENIANDVAHLNIEDRRVERFGYSYTVFSDVAQVLARFKNVVVLLPPNDYVKTKMAHGFVVPEPAVFYYFTGLKSVCANSADVSLANWALIVRGDANIVVRKMSMIPNADSLLDVYRQYLK
jgi:hypothetical protein